MCLLRLMSEFKNRALGLCERAMRIIILAALLLLCPEGGQAGGSGLNVLIVANQASSNSVELANYYRVKRQVPPRNVLSVSWAGSNVQWTHQEFTNTLLNPLLGFIAQNQLSNQIHYVVLSMDIPYRITGGQENSTTAALFYGFKSSPGGSDMENTYALSEARLEESEPDTAPTNSYLTMMLTAESLEEARRIIDRGVASDRTFPTQQVWLVKSSDPYRNIRYTRFDDAVFNSRLSDGYSLGRTNLDLSPSSSNLLGCQLGMKQFSLPVSTFEPGAIADNLTSFGGKIFENPDQTTLLEFIDAGASGSYGTVTEPLASQAKFPDPMVYFYQARGFTLAECYYQSVRQPFQGLFVGEPLASPWSRSFAGGWESIETNSVLQGTTNLCLYFTADETVRPLERIDLFLNGRYSQTLTNTTPHAGNRLTVQLNGYPISYEVPVDASLDKIASALAAEMNQATNSNITRVSAQAFGDRIELQSMAAPLPDGVFEVVDDEATFADPRVYLAAPSPISVSSSVSAGGWNGSGSFQVHFDSAPGVSNVLQASTNIVDWVDWVNVSTNETGGAMEYLDHDASLYAQRFYRVAVPSPAPTPHLLALGVGASNQFMVQITAPTNDPYVLQASSDFNRWSDIFTNETGSSSLFLDPVYSEQPARYYRTRSGNSNDYAPFTIADQTDTGGNILHVKDGVSGEIVVWASTNGNDWLPIFTHEGPSGIQTTTDSSSGDGESLTTHLRAASPAFLDSTVFGIRKFIVADGFPADDILDVGAYLRLVVTKTNGAMHTIALTNAVPGSSFTSFVQQFVDLVSAEPALQEADGLVVEDFIDGPFQVSKAFNLRARTRGRPAAQIEASLDASFPGFITTPSGSLAINENNSDLLARNHLYVSAGVPSITHRFDLDTTTLPDGHHELTAVAYEGTHVYSQTLKTIPVIVSNSLLQATLALAEPGSTVSVTDILDLVVTANTNDNNKILLFTTGGFHSGVTNQAGASFHVAAQDLGVGDHAFYALVATTNGLSYRTDKVNVTITR